MSAAGRRGGASVVLAVLLALAGCAAQPAARPADPVTPAESGPRVQHLATLPSLGLPLPVVSPDGRWVAYLDCDDPESVDDHAAFTGPTLERVSLVVQSSTSRASGARRVVAAQHACWPVWSPDSQRLIFIARDTPGRSDLMIYDLKADQMRRLSPGQPHLATPAVSPSGRYVAVAAFDQVADRARILVIDLHSGSTHAPAAPPDTQWAILPAWLDDDTLLCAARVGEQVALCGLSRTQDLPARLHDLPAPPNAIDVWRTQSGITHPLAPGGRWFAWYDSDADRLVLHDLFEGRRHALAPGTRAAAWLGGDLAAVAAPERLLLVESGRVRRDLLPGPWLPRAAAGPSTLLALRPGDQPETLELLRLRLGPE